MTISVQEQYEKLPYPFRDPLDENRRLVETLGDNLNELNHYCFHGKKNFRDNFRCLVVGGGTGDAAIYLAEQLKDTNAEIVYVDLSLASMDIAKKRAKIRNLNNIMWINNSLYHLIEDDIGKFNYINCSGVLHHLDDPQRGLNILKTLLTDDGAIYLMVYAKYGRRAIYLMQNLLRDLLSDVSNISDKIRLTRKIIDNLPSQNIFIKTKDYWINEISESGNKDSGLFDLLLHSIDKPYDIKEIEDLVNKSKLKFISFLGRDIDKTYDINHYSKLKNIITPKNKFKGESISEKMYGFHTRHCFYISKHHNITADFSDLSLKLTLENEMKSKNLDLCQVISPGKVTKIDFEVMGSKQVIEIEGNLINKFCFKHINGAKTIEEILDRASYEVGADKDEVLKELKNIFNLFHPKRWMYLSNGI